MRLDIDRVWAMPNKNTFSIPPIEKFILEELIPGLTIDPFANVSKIADVTNDLDPEYDTDYHLDALEFLKRFDTESVDTLLFDPPYTPRQLSECYTKLGRSVTFKDTDASFWSSIKDEAQRIIKPGGKVLSFGWNSQGIGKTRGFKLERVLLVCHGGQHNDTICVSERKVQSRL